MKKDLLVILLKVIVYACGLLLAYLGVSSLASCSLSRDSTANGRCTILIHDTTVINHHSYKTFNPFRK